MEMLSGFITPETIGMVLVLILGALGITKKIRAIGAEVTDLLSVVVKSLEPDVDGKVRLTSEELQMILKEAKDIPEALKNIIKK